MQATKTCAAKAIKPEVRRAKAKGQPVIALRQAWPIPSTKRLARLLIKGQGIAGLDDTYYMVKTAVAARLRGYDVARLTKAVLPADLEAAPVTFKRLAKAGVPLG